MTVNLNGSLNDINKGLKRLQLPWRREWPYGNVSSNFHIVFPRETAVERPRPGNDVMTISTK